MGVPLLARREGPCLVIEATLLGAASSLRRVRDPVAVGVCSPLTSPSRRHILKAVSLVLGA